MISEHNLTYECPKCGTSFSKSCLFASNSTEYNKARLQLPIPFAEDSEKKMCFRQSKCPNATCDEKRHKKMYI